MLKSYSVNVAGFGRVYNLPIYFQAIDGVSPSQSGIRVLPTILSVCEFVDLQPSIPSANTS